MFLKMAEQMILNKPKQEPFSPLEAIADLMISMRASINGEISVSSRNLATRWKWNKDRAHKFVIQQVQAGTICAEKRDSGVIIFPAPATSEQIRPEVKEEKFPAESFPMRLSRYMAKKISSWNSQFKAPNLQSWASHFDKLIRIDGKNPTEIGNMIDLITADESLDGSFGWRENILSPATLRKKWLEGKLITLTTKPIAGKKKIVDATYRIEP